MHKALLWKSLDSNRVQCRLCNHYCIVEDGGTGLCGVRQNQNGQLHTLVFDRVAAANLDPVEKKPLYHFLPGTQTFSIGTMGCNLRCANCQNYSLSQPPALGEQIRGQNFTAQDIVSAAMRTGAQSISYTYSEPTVFAELVYETSALAIENGLANILVSNGFMSREFLDLLGDRVHAANIDLKSMNPEFYTDICSARLQPVLDTLRRIRELGWWLEVTTLVIPGYNDSPEELERIAAFIANELGTHTPWHVSRFHPTYKLAHTPPTPASALFAAHQAGLGAGLKYIYLGNLPEQRHNSTICPGCGTAVIERDGFMLTSNRIQEHGLCPSCSEGIDGLFELPLNLSS